MLFLAGLDSVETASQGVSHFLHRPQQLDLMFGLA